MAFSGTNIIALADEYPLNITASAKNNDTAEIRISGVIHNWQNSSAEFKQKIDALIEKGIENVVLYINTPGGSVFEANEIANEIKRFKGTVTGFGGALVASAGSYLALVCDTFEMAENGQYMYHKPMAGIFGNEDKVTADLKLLNNLTKQYRTAYSEKTGMTEDEIEANWVKGDVWLSASEAKEQKFITSVSSKKETITENQKAMFVACGAPTIPKVKSNPVIMKNRNEIISKLGLSSDATDEQIGEAVAKAMEDSSKVKDLQTANENALKTNAETLVDKAILTDKKIIASLRDQYVKFAIADYDGTKAILEAMPPLEKPSANFEHSETTAQGREKWTLEDYQEKDPKALDKMMVENPKLFAELEASYFSK